MTGHRGYATIDSVWISSISLQNFRCFKTFVFNARKDLNIVVGENNVGKSAIFVAVAKLVALIWQNTAKENLFNNNDIRFNQSDGKLAIGCKFALDANDHRDLVKTLSPPEFDLNARRLVSKRLGNSLDTLEVALEWSPLSFSYQLKLGPLFLGDCMWSAKVGQCGPLSNGHSRGCPAS